MAHRDTISNISAKTHANQLLGSAKRVHIEPAIDQLSKRLMIVIKTMGGHVEFSLD